MKWRTHQACGVGIAFLRHLSPVVIAAAWAGSLLPDIFDQRAAGLLSLGRRDRQAVFARIHRGISHWFLLWLLLFAAAWGPIDEICRELSLDTAHSPNILPYLRESAYGLGLGGFLHVALDMLTPRGVPVLPFSGLTIAAPIVKTGSLGEYVFLVCLCLLLAFCWVQDFSWLRSFPRPF